MNNTVPIKNYLSNKVSFGSSAAIFIAFICALSLFADNGVYLCICLMSIVIIINMLWRYNRPGIGVFAFLMQWIQVVSYVIWMNATGRDIDWFSENAKIAIILSCLGLILMAVIMHLCTRKLFIPGTNFLKQEAEKINGKKLLIVYIASTLFLSSIGFVFGSTSGAAQFLITISSLKWVFFMLYGFVVWIKGKNKLIFIAIIFYEFLTSLYSYFSSFKEVIFYTIIIALTFVRSVKFKQLVYGWLTVAALALLILTWSAIKNEYRRFVSKGQMQQAVAVERSEAFGQIQGQVQALSWTRYQQAIYLTLYRVQYIYNFALAMDRVPDRISYQNGSVWWDNISFVLTPRFLFPGKGVYSASEKANKFTGKNYSGLKEGSSFSLGYFVDCFVDFGHIGMFIPLLFIGLFVAVIYRVFYKMESLNFLLRFAIINVCLYNFISFEADGLYLFGRLLTTFLVYLLLAKTIFPSLQSWLYTK